jgi:hypothetical protein
VEDEKAVREKKIIAILNEEVEDGADLASESRRTIEFLLREKKGYSGDEVRRDVVFEVVLGQEKLSSAVDFLITWEGRTAMIIKCSAGSLDSRERQAVAAARLLGAPIAVVADPVTAEVLDTASGTVMGEGFGAIPVREQLPALLAEREMKQLTHDRIEREKRILLAFDAIRCSVPQGGTGGVRIGPDPAEPKGDC